MTAGNSAAEHSKIIPSYQSGGGKLPLHTQTAVSTPRAPSSERVPAMTAGEVGWIVGVVLAAVAICYFVGRYLSSKFQQSFGQSLAPAQNRRVLYYSMAAFAIVAIEAVLVVYAIGEDGYALPEGLGYRDAIANFGFAIGIGLLVGATELISRYRDEPFAPLISTPGAFYIFINGGAAALAYYLLSILSPHMTEPLRVLTAGFASMAFFRSALFNVRLGTGGTDIPVGPNLVLLIVLKALDRTYDRARAAPRSLLAKKIVGQLSFAQVSKTLPALCFDLMQNLAPEETAAITSQVNNLARATDISDDSKALSLGLALLNLVGEKTLRAAVDALGPSGKAFRKIDDDLAKALALPKPEDVIASLATICKSLYDADPGNEPITNLPDFSPRPGLTLNSQMVLIAYQLVNFYGYQLVYAAAQLIPR